MCQMCLRGVSVVLIVFDVTNRESFDAVPGIAEFVETSCKNDEEPMVVLVANKCDQEREVSEEEGHAMKKRIGAALYKENSCMQVESSKELFNQIGIWLFKNREMSSVAEENATVNERRVRES